MTGSIHEFAAEFHISLAKARRMAKAGWLNATEQKTVTDEIRIALTRGQNLTVAQLVELIENPGGLLELGKYTGKAEEQLAALGDPVSEAAPKEVAANILEAYRNEPEGVGIVARWLVSIIPPKPVGHAYVAVRLLLGVPANIRKFDVPHMRRALVNCRAHPCMTGLSRSVRKKSVDVTVYQKKALDL